MISKQMLNTFLKNAYQLKQNHPIRIVLILFMLSALYLGILNAVEIEAGISKSFHIDSQTYADPEITKELCYRSFEGKITDFFRGGYFCTSNLLGPDISILLNAILYCVTTVILMDALIRARLSVGTTLLITVIIFAPYRAHLAIHLLKDSIIHFFVCLGLFYRGGVLWSIPLMFFRGPASLLYFGSLFSIKKIMVITAAALVVIIPMFWDPLIAKLEILMQGNNIIAVYQDYDNVPTFQDMGLFGDFLRFIMWPGLLITGAFIITSPAIFFVPIAIIGLPSVILILLSNKSSRLLSQLIKMYFSIGVIAYVMPGYTSFIRYSYPFISIVLVAIIIDTYKDKQEKFDDK